MRKKPTSGGVLRKYVGARRSSETKQMSLFQRPVVNSTLASQGYGRGVNLELLHCFNEMASHGITPALTFLLDCPVEVGLPRTALRVAGQKVGKRREDRFEREKVEFHERVRKGFLELARAEPDRIYVLDASHPIQEVHEEIRRAVDGKFQFKG